MIKEYKGFKLKATPHNRRGCLFSAHRLSNGKVLFAYGSDSETADECVIWMQDVIDILVDQYRGRSQYLEKSILEVSKK
jgi:hypothetical protein